MEPPKDIPGNPPDPVAAQRAYVYWRYMNPARAQATERRRWHWLWTKGLRDKPWPPD